MTATFSTTHADTRRLEMAAIGLVLLLQSGALFPLLAATDGSLDPSSRAMLRMLLLPVYAITLGLAVRHHRQIVAAALGSLPLVALTLLPVVSVVWSLNPTLSLRRAIALLFSLLLAYVLAVRCTPRQLLWLVANVTGLCVAGSLLLMVVNPGLAITPDDGALRGVYLNKNVLGWAASLAVIAGLIVAADRRIFGSAIFVIGGAGLLLSQSGTGAMAVIVGLVLMAFHLALAQFKGMWRALFLLLSLMLGAMALLFQSFLLVPLLEALGKDATLTGRVPLWALVDPKILERPILGYGYGTFWSQDNGAVWAIWDAIGWQAPHAHSGYRDVLLNIGVVGAVVMAIVFVQALRRGTRKHLVAQRSGWLWPNVLLGQILFINMSESTLMMQNDLQWILASAIIVMFACHRTAAG